MKLAVWTLLATVSGLAVAAPPPGIRDRWSDGYVYTNGMRMHYYHALPAPGKPIIVMVHGVTDNGLCWTTLTEDLQKSYDIYMVDMRGHGLSDPFTDTDTGTTLMDDVVGFVHAMKFEKPILMGHSMGAATVMRIGAMHPDLARAVIMLDPRLAPMGPGAPGRAGAPGASAALSRAGAPPMRPTASSTWSLAMFEAPEALVAQNNTSLEELVSICGKQNPKWDPVDCQYWALSKKQYHGPYTEAQSHAMTGTMSTADALSKITVPALILKADAPPDVRKANEEAASVMQPGKLVHIDGAAHNLHHDQRKRTVQEITAFLNTL